MYGNGNMRVECWCSWVDAEETLDGPPPLLPLGPHQHSTAVCWSLLGSEGPSFSYLLNDLPLLCGVFEYTHSLEKSMISTCPFQGLCSDILNLCQYDPSYTLIVNYVICFHNMWLA